MAVLARCSPDRSGQALEARQEFESLSEERSYYGFLAADELGRDYALEEDRLSFSEPTLQLVAGIARHHSGA